MAYYTQEQLKQMRESLKQAKENPDNARSQEIFKRIREGKMNFELKALGLPEVPIERPKLTMPNVQQQPGVQTEVPKSPVFGRVNKEMGRDALEIATGMGEQISRGADKMQDIWGNDNYNVLQKFVGTVGAAAGAGAGVIGEGFTGVGKMALSQESEDKLSAKMQEIGEDVSETKIAKGVVDWYEGLDENEKLIIDAAGGVLALAAEFVGAKGAGKVGTAAREGVDAAAPVIRQGLRSTADFGVKQAQNVQSKLSDAYGARRAAQVTQQEQKVQTAVERITQAGDDPRAIEQATRALTDIDTTDVKTYADLNNKFDDRIVALSRQVDARIEEVPGTFKPDDFAKVTKVGDEVVTENPIGSALDGLEGAYTKSGEAVNAARIRQLKQKFESEGLTLKEANDLAREYGIEFRDRAFTKMGDPKSGYNAENYENVRKGVKEVVRDKMPDDTTKELDRKMSDIYTTRDMTRKLSDKVAKLEQRIKNRTLAQKAGGALASLVDLSTGGMLRGFVSRILPSNVGNKAMNSIEIQKELQKNLREIDTLLNMKDGKSFDDAVSEYLNNMQPGLSIRSTVRPDSVAKKMDAEDFANVTKIIDNPEIRTQYEDMLSGMGLQNATDDELVSFLKEVVDEYEGVASRPVMSGQ